MSARRPLRSAVALAAALLVGFLFSAGAEAAPGDLDTTFSGDGKQTTDLGLGLSSAAATVLQPDGKIVAVGTDLAHGSGVFALARYNPNGSLDTSFSGDGRQRTEFDAGLDHGAEGATGVALQENGKIVAVGGGSGDFMLARYNPNGSLDTSFSGDGKQTTDFTGFDDHAAGVALQGNGKIVAVGSDSATAGGDFLVARYNPNGSLDTSFSGDGRQTTDFGGGEFGDDEATGVALRGDGKLVVVGCGGVVCSDFALARFNANGSLDTTFSGDGKQTTDFGGRDGATAVALEGNGKIVAVGSASGTTSGDFLLARYNPNGSLDTSFSGDGKQTTDFFGATFEGEGATGVALQGDGKIVAVGRGGSGDDFAIARYSPSGTLDTSFSADGMQVTDFGGDDGANGAVLQGDGKIVVVGAAGGVGSHDFALARYNANGSLDPSFSGGGKRRTNFGGFNNLATGVAAQGDGKIVAVGRAGPNSNFALARYNPNGSLDTSFSGDGKQTTDFGGDDIARGIALQSDGKIIVVGDGPGDFGRDFLLARYNTDGSLDTSFSGDGKQTTDFGARETTTAVALQGDGKIVVVGIVGDFNSDFALARYNPNGSLDTSFSGDGKQTTGFGEYDQATAVALQGNGKIVVVGGAFDAGDFLLARFNPNGTLDPSFSGDGKQTTNFGGGDAATGVAVQGDGKIVAVGGGGTNGNFALARYNANGSLDPSFSGDGRRQTDLGNGDGATAVALQGNGKIVAVGFAGGVAGSDFALARYNPNASLDLSFSGDGKQTTDFGDVNGGGAAGVALQGNGKIVAVGNGLGADGTSAFAVARYLGG